LYGRRAISALAQEIEKRSETPTGKSVWRGGRIFCADPVAEREKEEVFFAMDAYNAGSRPKKRKRLGVDNFENDDEAHREANPSQPASCMNEVDGKILLKCPNHAAEVLTGLERLLQDKRLCDVIVQVGDSEFHAHRVVLAASSDMLRALLIGGWKETDEKVLPSAPPRHIASDSIFFRQGPSHAGWKMC
jgi:hypothetical protein